MRANLKSNPFLNANITTCGGVFNPVYTHTLVDDDIDLQTTKVGPAGTLSIGSTIAYTVTFANATPSVLTIAPLTAHNAALVAINDPQPTGVIFSSWTCTANSTICPTARLPAALMA